MKILVADDNRSIAKKVTEALKAQGCEVVGVAHGEAAVKKLPDFMPDLVLADVFMPVRNGYEVCEYVKNDQRFSHIPVVLLIGAFDPIDQHEVKRVRADGLLKKPFDPPDDLLQMVRTMMEKAAQARQEAGKKDAGPAVGDTVEMSAGEMKGLVKEAKAPEPEPEAEEFSVRPARIEFGEGAGAGAMSFGELMETPTEEEGPKAVEEGPRSEESGFRASSVPDIEFAGEKAEEETDEEPTAAVQPEAPAWGAMDSATEESSAAAAHEPETPQWGGVEVPAKEPSPDAPPIKVEFEASEETELVTEESSAPAPSLVESGPLPELATSPDEFLAAASSPAVQPSQMEVEPFAIPAMEEVAVPPIAEAPMPPPPPKPSPVAAAKTSREPEQVVPPTFETPRTARAFEMDSTASAAVAAAPDYTGNTDAFGRPAQMNTADMDAIVEKVIARLQAGVLDKITRDILRPIVEALVANEVTDKK